MQPYGQFDTGVEVGRNATAMRRAEPGRSVVRSLAARVLTVALLAALAALAALPAPPLQAQTVTTLVSNTGQSVGSSTLHIGHRDKNHTQGFTTGSNAGGYNLTSVGVYVFEEDFDAGEAMTVLVYTRNADGSLGTLEHTLLSPATYVDNAVNTFTAPSGATLAASTDYLVVFSGTGSDGVDFKLRTTDSDNEDTGGEAGWSIENGRRFNGSLNNQAFMIDVRGSATTAIPTLVSNTDLPSSLNTASFEAQSFETGATTGGYTVSEVDIYIVTGSGKSTSVKIREDDNGEPATGDPVATLTNPDTLMDSSLNTFTASDVITLAASKTYWISVNEGITSVSNRATFGRVEGDDETGEPGWSIGDGRLWRDAETSGWTSSDHSLMMAIKGSSGGITLSDDARLSALSVSPRDIIGFYGPHTSYEVGVDPTVDVATVSATVNHAGASVVIYPADTDTVVAGHQVGLLAGSNVVTVSVTAEDGLTKREYTVSVNRGVTDAKGWQAGADLDGLIDGRNEFPRGIWSDETTVWVADAKSEKLFAYTLADGMRDAGKDITLDANNNHPFGIWSYGTTMWVADWTDAKLYAYTLADGMPDADKDITLHADNAYPSGIWSDETTMWVADHVDAKVYAYTLSDGTQDADKEFTLHADNADPAGIWSDETTMWVVDDNDDKLYAYTLSGGMRDGQRDVLVGVYLIPAGLWSDGTTMWVADRNVDRLYAYTLSDGTREADKTIKLDSNNNNPYGIWSDGTTMWVVESGGMGDIFAYTLESGMPDADKDITPHHTNNDPRGIWSDGTTMWVVDQNDAKLYAYTLEGGMRDAGKDIVLHWRNDDPTGIWSNGTTVWVMDRIDYKVYAYTLVGGMRENGKEFTLHFRNHDPKGIWSDGTTMWVADTTDEKLYAYTLAAKARDEDRDFDDLASAGNDWLRGIWSDRTTMWVSDWFDEKVYAYNMPAAAMDDATLSLLNLSDVTLAPRFVSGTTSYTASAGNSVTSTTVTAHTTNPKATRVIKLGATEYADGIVPLAEGDNIITVVVTAEDGAATQTYTVTVTRSGTPSTDATLSSLNLSNVTLDSTFASGTQSYTASVANSVMSTAVTAHTTDPNAAEPVIKRGGTEYPDGIVPLAGGDNIITVEVTAEDGTTTQTYTVTVTRDAPPLSNDATLSSLSLSVTLAPTFVSGTYSYTASVANDITSTTVTAETADSNATSVIKLDGTEDADGTVALALGANTITVEVTAEDGTTTLTYTVTVTRDAPLSNDATLSSLSLSDGTLDPTFMSGTQSYTASVANSVTSTMVTAETTDPNAAEPVIKLDGTEDTDGTVALAEGNNIITVEVTAEDGTTTLTYTVTVTRATDTANLVLSRASLSVGEAGSDTFTVKLATLPSANVTVTVSSDDTGAATVSPASLTFTTTNWNATQEVTVSGEDDSDTDNEILTVTASASGGGYTGKTDTVSVTVTDNDTAQTVPGAPRNLRATASGQTQIDLAWDAPSSNGNSAITGYKIEVSTNAGSSWSDLVADTGNPNDRTYFHTGLSAGTTRHYQVSAINAVGTGNPSNIANATTGVTTVTFGASSYTATEGGSSATVVVRLSQAPATQVTIPLTTMHRGGATGGDYTGIPDDVMFTSGQTQSSFTVTAVDDSFDDDGESVRIGFDELPSGYAQGSPAMTTVALVDDEGSLRVVVGFTTHWAHVGERRESESRFKVPVRLDREPLRSVTIPLVVTHLGGATAADYTGIPASVTFGPNDTKADFFMYVIPDEEREIGERVLIDFGDLPSSVSKDWWGSSETIEFVDDLLDSTVWFGTDAYTATEGGAAALVSIHLDAPVKLEPLDVGLVLRYGGGATAADHGSIPTVVTFDIGERTKTITVAATNDSDDDDGESVTLSFVNVSGDRVNISHQPTMANTTTVSLADDDGTKPVTVSFGAATYTAREGGSGASVSVELDATPGRSVTIPLVVTRVGGATTADYSGVPASVTFGANETRKTFTVMAVDDTTDDAGESLSIGFGTLPANVSAGSPAVVALDDDDGSSVRRVTVGFDTAEHIAFQVRESTWPSRITLSLNRVAQRTVTIPLVVTHLGGATEADYTGIPASVTFGPDQRRVGFRVYGTLDEEIESGEGLRIGFGPLPLPPGVRVESSRSYETVEFVDTSNNPSTGTPTIRGTPQVGENLKADTADIGDADGLAKVTYSYQWIRNDGSTDTDIENATDSRYTVAAENEGQTVKVKVSFTDDAGNNENLTSEATEAVGFAVQQQGVSNTPATGQPTISGTAQVGEMLTADTSGIADADGLNNATFSYQWVANDGAADTDISGETDAAYTLVDGDEGRTVKVRVIVTDDLGNETTLTSAATEAVEAAPQPDSPATGRPTISGTARVGEELTADTTGITDDDGLVNATFSYQWVANDGTSDTDIFGAADNTYTLVAGDEGRTIKVRVIVTDDAENETTLTSEATDAVAAAPQPDSPATGQPTISGTARVGEMLTADTSGIADADGLTNVTYSYQWLSDDAEIGGATGATYTLVDDDEGRTIKVRVTVTDDLGNETTLTSAATEAVDAKRNTAATGRPTISGTVRVGETLTADTTGIGDADGLTNVSYSYQWVVTDGGAYIDISGETGATYTLVSADRGLYILVRVSFTDDAGKREKLASAETEVVAAAA